MAKLKARDIEAYGNLYADLAAPLFKIIFTLAEDREAANPILEKMFIDCWHNINFFDGNKQTLFVWMVRIAVKLSKKTPGLTDGDILKRLKIKHAGFQDQYARKF